MKTSGIIKPTRPHLNHRVLPLAALALMAFASSAAAAPLYQESFATPCVSADFSATYPGFTKSGPAVNVNAAGYASTDSPGSGGLWRTMPASMPIYDWALPLTISAEIGANGTNGGQSIGVFFGNASGLATAGITFRPFIPSVPNGENVESANGNNRGQFGLGGNTAIAPGVVGGGALTKISFTIRENAANSLLFDWLAKVNDTEVWTAVAYGGTGTSGWHLGIPKSNLNASGGLSTFGLGYDGVTPRIDNLTQEGPVSAPPAGGYDAWAGSPHGYDLTGGAADRGADPDGDGFTNMQEFLFGASPVAGNGILVTSETVGGGLVLHWLQRASGCSYLLQESITMGAGDWSTSAIVPVLDDQSGVPTGYERYKATISTSETRKFFRVEGAEN